MTSLVQMPFSEVTATLELLGHWGVNEEDLQSLRSSRVSPELLLKISNLIKHGMNAMHDTDLSKIVIDGDADPYVPAGYEVIEHRKCGKVRLSQLDLHVAPCQRKNGAHDSSRDPSLMEKELTGVPVLNANVFWYLYENPWHIPAAWVGWFPTFWGTKYRKLDLKKSPAYMFSLQWFPGGRNYQGSTQRIKNANWRHLPQFVEHGPLNNDCAVVIRRR